LLSDGGRDNPNRTRWRPCCAPLPWSGTLVDMRRRIWKELGYALLGLPLAVFGFAYVVLAVPFSGLSVTLLGVPLLATLVMGARGWGAMYRKLGRAALGLQVGDPAPMRRRPGLIGWIRSGLGDATGWRAMAYLFVKLPLGIVTGAVGFAFYGYGLMFLSYPIWFKVTPGSVDGSGREHPGMGIGSLFLDTWPRAFALSAVGVLVLLAAPWVVRLVLWPDRLLIRALLGPTARDARVADLERTRAYAVDESAAVLRRIERDLHDGAQARLVAVAMKLGMAREKLGEDVDPGTRELLDTAHRNAKEAIAELRDLARGIHPPVLDKGLDAALATLAARSPVPVGLRVTTPHRPAPAIETIAYFCVAELLTNVAKHSRATRVSVEVSERDGRLSILVADDGSGGARPRTGLSGLHDRVRTVDGAMDLDSPPGGGTTVTIDLPMSA
jgi:signal transduction histidine kinase